MTAKTLSLNDLCDPHGNEIAKNPWHINYDGPYLFATDAQMALLIRSSLISVVDVIAKKPARKINNKIMSLLNGCRVTIGRTTADKVKAWTGEHEQLKEVLCDNCRGNGKCVCCCGQPLNAAVWHIQTLRSVLESFINENVSAEDAYIQAAYSIGKVMAFPDCREGMISEYCFDRNLIANAFSFVDGPCAVMTGRGLSNRMHANPLIEFRGDGWRVLVCPLTDNRIMEDAPQLELEKLL